MPARWPGRRCSEVRGSVRALRGDEPPAPLSAMLTGLVRQAGAGEPQVTLTVTGDEAAIAAGRAHGAVPRGAGGAHERPAAQRRAAGLHVGDLR